MAAAQTKKRPTEKIESDREDLHGLHKTCLVTPSTGLAKSLRQAWKYPDALVVRQKLVNAAKEQDCVNYIVDTRVGDISMWPALLSTTADADSKGWFFVVHSMSAIRNLQPLPRAHAFFELASVEPGEVAASIRRALDPELGRRISAVEYQPRFGVFLIEMSNGKRYPLSISDLPDADNSEVKDCRIEADGSYLSVEQESGNRFEVPWDVVLYHCEPEYEYYRDKPASIPSDDSAKRIGGRVRALREKKGLSVQALADRAGMQRPNLSRLELGKHRPSLETLERVADALGVPVADIIAKR